MITKDLLFLDKTYQTSQEIFEAVAQKAFALKLVNDVALFVDALNQRESEIPTAVGFDIAIPHCRSVSVNEPLVGFVRLKDPIVWSSKSEDSVKLLFLIGIPEMQGNGNLHLKYLSLISKKMMHASFRERLLEAKNEDAIFEILNEINERIEVE